MTWADDAYYGFNILIPVKILQKKNNMEKNYAIIPGLFLEPYEIKLCA